ncbi:MAG: aminomethyl-transferring glycine dehydrogenase subunit GcvPB [Acidimicrobiales bacterium]|jgi:glycine dehydrogenase subunit 2
MNLSKPAGRALGAPILARDCEPTIFEFSAPGRYAASFRTTDLPEWTEDELVPDAFRRNKPVALPEVSERDLAAHFTRLTHRQYSVDLGAYPLGSCTMKYNPKASDAGASIPGFVQVHPAAPPKCTQGWLEVLVELEEGLCAITGMDAATLQPAAGAAGELTGLLLMRAYHEAHGESERRSKVIIPDSAHGTNPASVTLSGYEVVTVGTNARGGVDLDALKALLADDVAGIMLTNPSTLGLFEEDIVEIAQAVHEVGGLLYYDGANLNAILGVVRPGDMGFDIVHMNVHKTFATPHGGGGPGAGPVAVCAALTPFLPGPRPARTKAGFALTSSAQSIGRVHSWHGNALVLLRAWIYLRLNGSDGLRRVSEAAVLNANFLKERLRGTYDIPYDRTVMHECVVSAKSLHHKVGLRAFDVAKRLMELGFHPPTMYFPLIVEEALMIEPTETESPQTVSALADALLQIANEALEAGNADDALAAPRTTPVGRVDDARAARQLVVTFDQRGEQ